jgi:hypothetical protein
MSVLNDKRCNNSNRSADIAFIENDKIKYIFEICYKNKTKEEH